MVPNSSPSQPATTGSDHKTPEMAAVLVTTQCLCWGTGRAQKEVKYPKEGTIERRGLILPDPGQLPVQNRKTALLPAQPSVPRRPPPSRAHQQPRSGRCEEGAGRTALTTSEAHNSHSGHLLSALP